MGLACQWDEDDYYLPAFAMSGLILIPIDYGYAHIFAADLFRELAIQWAPRDTGYLRSTIDSRAGSAGVYTWTNCEYAQYPEFGTWCQPMQAYYRPAIYEAFRWWVKLTTDAYNSAQEEADRIAEAAAIAAEEDEQEELMDPENRDMFGEVDKYKVYDMDLVEKIVKDYKNVDTYDNGAWQQAYNVSKTGRRAALNKDGQLVFGNGPASEAAAAVFQQAAFVGQALGDAFMGAASFTGTAMGIGAMALAFPIALLVYGFMASLFGDIEKDFPEVEIT